MNNLLARTVSGIILVLIVVGSVLWNEYAMLALTLVVFSLGFYEFRKMFNVQDRSLFLTFLVTGLAALVTFFLFLSGRIDTPLMLGATALLLTVIFTHVLVSKKATIAEAGKFLSAMVWLAGSLVFFIALGRQKDPASYHALYPLILLIMIWLFDVGAFVFGSLLGKTKIAPAISPGKTLEGLLSGTLLNALAGYVVFRITGEHTVLAWILLGVVISIGATAGDLLESKLKREAGIKDSGNLIPGHGGILDRFDSMLFAAPLFFVTLQIIASL
ncbi:MAG: phosphatidate cytidylyltransferase [Bacteroidales bacterium]|nr:phosphatidate cytidylyltransferase [Bacteroidales bacterium]